MNIDADSDKKTLENVVLIISAKSIIAKPFKTKLSKILTGMINPKIRGTKQIKMQINLPAGLTSSAAFFMKTLFPPR